MIVGRFCETPRRLTQMPYSWSEQAAATAALQKLKTVPEPCVPPEVVVP